MKVVKKLRNVGACEWNDKKWLSLEVENINIHSIYKIVFLTYKKKAENVIHLTRITKEEYITWDSMRISRKNIILAIAAGPTVYLEIN